jgi:hypothetical protein
MKEAVTAPLRREMLRRRDFLAPAGLANEAIR